MPAPPRSPRPLRLLIVDDHACSRHGLVALLALQEDLEIVGEAENGSEAIELAGRYRPDVVLMDIEMPVMDGVEATRRITRLWPDMHVVILSMHDEALERVVDEGAHAALVKGEAPERLLTLLSQLHGRVGRVDQESLEDPGDGGAGGSPR